MQDCALPMELLQSCTVHSNWPCHNGTALYFVYAQLLIKYAAPDLWPTAPIPPSIPVTLYRPCYTVSGRDNWPYEYIEPGRTVVFGIMSEMLELSNEENLISKLIFVTGIIAWDSHTSNGQRDVLNFQVSPKQAPFVEVFLYTCPEMTTLLSRTSHKVVWYLF